MGNKDKDFKKNVSTGKKPDGKGVKDTKDDGAMKGFTSKFRNKKFNTKDSLNDFSWYNESPQLVKDVANLAYSDFLGLPVNLGSNDTVNKAFPGLCKILLYPTLGNCGTKGDAPNIAAQTLYAYVRSYNSGSRNYYATDYFMYIYSVASLYGVFAELVRIYGLCRKYSIENRYMGQQLVESMGYNYTELVSNLTNLRAIINNFALQLNSFAIPAKFNYIDRLTWIPLHVYKDADINKAQLYAMQYSHTYKWNPDTIQSGSALEPTPTPWAESGSRVGIDDIKQFIDDLLYKIRLNEDVAIMSGDTYKAFGPQGIRSISMIPEDVICEPIYNEGVLAQIHNARMAGKVFSYAEDDLNYVFGLEPAEGIKPADMVGLGWIYQDNEVIVCEQFVDAESVTLQPNPDMTYLNNMKILLDCPYGEPSPEFNMEASRLISHPQGRYLTRTRIHPTTNYEGYEVGCSGTEIVTDIRIYYYSAEDNAMDDFKYNFMNESDNRSDITFEILASKFDWAPYQYCAIWNNDSESWENVTVFGDTFNYSVVPLKNIMGMHDVAILSLFNLVSLLQKTRDK